MIKKDKNERLRIALRKNLKKRKIFQKKNKKISNVYSAWYMDKKNVQRSQYDWAFFRSSSIEGKISYGLSSMGYDVRISDEYRIFTNVNNSLVDPKNFSEENFVSKKGDHCIIPPNSFVLAKTVEYFKIPKMYCVFVGKSTYARCGIIVNVTPIENSFEGNIVIELSNTTPNPAKIYSNRE